MPLQALKTWVSAIWSATIATLILVLFALCRRFRKQPLVALSGPSPIREAPLIAGARVTVTNVATGGHWETTSRPDGSYQVLELPIGNYSVSVQEEGFGTAVTQLAELQIQPVSSCRHDTYTGTAQPDDIV